MRWTKMVFCLWVVGWVGFSDSSLAKTSEKTAKKEKNDNAPKIINKKEFDEALIKLAKDERIPVASSTLVEKGRGEDYYSVEKLMDNNPETFWAEGVKGFGKDQWVAFHLPDGTTHVEIVPGAGKEQFENFNRPKSIFLDIYRVILKRENEEYKPKYKWLGRSIFEYKDKSDPVREKLSVKLQEVARSDRTLYVGVLILQTVYKGQFDDTAVNELKTFSVWGEP
jgi:hypothetical protein